MVFSSVRKSLPTRRRTAGSPAVLTAVTSIVTLLGSAPACVGAPPPGGPDGRGPGTHPHVITVSCAVSVEAVVDTLVARTERASGGARIRVNAGASSILARQIEAGAEVDLFVSADLETVQRLAVAGWIDSASILVLASNRVVAITPSDRPIEVRAPADLGDSRVRRVAIADTVVPIGRYAEAFLRHAGLQKALAPRIARTDNVRATLAAVAAGAADLGFVYATDARTTDKVEIVWRIPPEEIPPVRIAAGIVKGHDRREVRELLDILRAEESWKIFEKMGFEKPGDADR